MAAGSPHVQRPSDLGRIWTDQEVIDEVNQNQKHKQQSQNDTLPKTTSGQRTEPVPARDEKRSNLQRTRSDQQQIERVNETLARHHRTSRPPTSRPSTGRPTTGRNRHSVHWPFLHSDGENDDDKSDASSFRLLTPSSGRRATWQHGKRNSSSTVLETIVPDYVVNYLRGETAETVARKREMKKNQQSGSRDLTGADDGTLLDADSASHRPGTNRGDGDPETGAGRQHGPTPLGLRAVLSGWRGGITINGAVGVGIIVTTVVVFVLAISRARGGETRVYEGSCASSQQINFGIHAGINLFAVALLAGACYAWQVMSSPTRIELDMAHDAKRWLDIGIPSLRNFRFISKRRAVMLVLVMVTVITMQIMYNAVIFTTQIVPSHNILIVSESFVEGAEFSDGEETNAGGIALQDVTSLQDLASRNELSNLTIEECFRLFQAPFQMEYDAVLVLTNADSDSSALLQTAPPASSLADYFNTSDPAAATFDSSEVTYCLAQSSTEFPRCALDTNDTILGEAILIAVFTVVPALALLGSKSFQPLVTVGDAVASFLSRPDHHTRGACLLTREDVKKRRWAPAEARHYRPRRHWWLQAPTLSRWSIWLISWAVPVGTSAALLALLIYESAPLQSPFDILPFSMPSAASSSAAETRFRYLTLSKSTSHASVSILSALPHVLVAVLFLTTNALLSNFFLSHELSRYARPSAALPLRVSVQVPQDVQTSSLYLAIPHLYSWLLLVLFVPLSLFLSFALHPVIVAFTPPTPSSPPSSQEEIKFLVADPLPLVVVLGLLLCILALVLGLGLRQAEAGAAIRPDGMVVAGNPLALKEPSCSAVIAARSQRLPSEPDAALGKLSWGVIRAPATEQEQQDEGPTAGILGFSAMGVGKLDLERGYA